MGNEATLLSDLAKKFKKIGEIDRDLFQQYDVKTGLRNADSTSVVAGLTRIGDVVGYRKDGEEVKPIEGKLLYRGYKLSDIVNGFQEEGRHGFDEVCYLLLNGDLPNEDELDIFSNYLAERRKISPDFKKSILLANRGNPEQNLMNSLAREVLTMYSLDENPEDRSVRNILRQTLNLIAKYPTLLVYITKAYQHYNSDEPLAIRDPKKSLSTAENFLYMLKGENYTQLDADILDLCLALHAEHGGGNNSSFTARSVSSAGTDTYSAISAAIGSLKGIYHGGANVKVMEMIDHIKKNVDNWEDREEIADYLLKILKKEVYDQTGKIYGFGHAVYTYSDPRTPLLREKAAEIAEEKDRKKEFVLYKNIEELVPEVFAKYKGREKHKIIAANVDFYSGFVYSNIGIPTEMYTPLFSMARMAGWCAHRLEQIYHSSRRIIRPTYKNVEDKKDYIHLDQRE